MNSLNITKSTGVDNIPLRFLKVGVSFLIRRSLIKHIVCARCYKCLPSKIVHVYKFAYSKQQPGQSSA